MVEGFSAFVLSNDSYILPEVTGYSPSDGTFSARFDSLGNNVGGLPSDPYQMSTEQQKVTATMLFSDTSAFLVTFEIVESKGADIDGNYYGRNVFFAGAHSLREAAGRWHRVRCA